MDLSKENDNNSSENVAKKKKVTKKVKPEIQLPEYIVPISANITSEKKMYKILKKEGARIKRVLKTVKPTIFNIIEDDDSVSDISMDTCLEVENVTNIDDNISVVSEDTVSIEPDIPAKFTERQVPNYPEKSGNPIKEPIDHFYLEMQVLSFTCKYKIKLRVQPIYQNQKDAAVKLCETYTNTQKVIQLLISRTQTGKTGCMIEFIYQYIQRFKIPIEHIFVITPLSSTDWKIQTKERFPEDIDNRIYHLPELMTRFKEDVECKKNILILIDEAHCASLKRQTLQKLMSEDGLGWNLDKMFENDIKIVQFSATPDGLIYGLTKKEWPEQHYHVHMMEEGQGYYGIKQMMNRTDRVVLKQSKDLNGRDKFGEWISDKKQEEVEENINEMFTDMISYTEPKYCIMRGHGSNFENIKENILSTADKYLRSTGQYTLFDWDIKEYIQDGNIDVINDLLKVNPKKHVIILIKEKLKCSNTLIKKHIGVVYERLAKEIKDSFIIQGLIGRITGYERHDIICYTNIETLKNYELLFKDKFSKEVLKNVCWNSNSTRANKKGTKGKQTYIDPQTVILGETGEIEPTNKITQDTFSTINAAKEWLANPVNNITENKKSVFHLYDSDNNKYKSENSVHDLNNVYIRHRGDLRKVVSEEETRKSKDIFWGVKTSSRICPVIKDNKIMYIILHK